MNKLIQRFFVILSIMLINGVAVAQETSSGLDHTMRNNGKIYVVVAGCLIILIGLFIYMFTIDRKLRRMEKENKQGS